VTKDTSDAKQDTQKYLEIKDWGVRFTLSSGIFDVDTRNGVDASGYYFLSTNSLKDIECSIDNTAGGGYYFRFKPGDINSETKLTYMNEYPDAIKLGDYEYAWGRNPVAAECGKDSATQEKANKAAEEFKTTLKTIQQL
jgi:hypothetical protein